MAVTRTLSLPSTKFGGKLKKNRLESIICDGDTSSSSEEEKLCCNPSACKDGDIEKERQKEKERIQLLSFGPGVSYRK